MKSIVLLLSFCCCFAVISLINCVNATNSKDPQKPTNATEPQKSTNATEPQKLQVEVYYETLCPDSMRFVRNQLYDTITRNNWLPYVNLDFIPYGKVGVWTDPSTNITNLYCQHGQRECELNALHACIVEHNTQQEQLNMFNCMLNGYSTEVDTCSTRLEIDVTAAKNCKATRSTNDILKKYGDRTDAIEITFVPSIGISGVFDPWKQRAILYNFSRVFCRKYKEKFEITLEKC